MRLAREPVLHLSSSQPRLSRPTLYLGVEKPSRFSNRTNRAPRAMFNSANSPADLRRRTLRQRSAVSWSTAPPLTAWHPGRWPRWAWCVPSKILVVRKEWLHWVGQSQMRRDFGSFQSLREQILFTSSRRFSSDPLVRSASECLSNTALDGSRLPAFLSCGWNDGIEAMSFSSSRSSATEW